jgi:glyceraldehyde 3-phosphate dehydrogenase
MVKVGINGFGRIGRLALRAIGQCHREKLKVVALNDLTDAGTCAHLFKYDTSYGIYPGEVEGKEGRLIVDGEEIRVLQERDPAHIPWGEVDIVLECTGLFTDARKSAGHLSAGAKKVIISAPAQNEDITIVLGVNEGSYDPKRHHIVSCASCTTNCIAPVVKVLQQNFGVQRGFLSTIHAYTNDQRILDQFHKDLRRARSAALNIIPTTTGAAQAVTLVIPELAGRLDGMAFRVPVATVSLCDFVCTVEREVTVERVNRAFREASQGYLKGIMEYCEEELVSSDFRGNAHSSIVDGKETMVIPPMVKVLSWYDNEWGYSSRLADLASYMADKERSI